MVKIANFSSVLEIAFGLNALFYLFELIPRTEDRLKELLARNAELYEKKVELTKNTESFPIGFMVGAKYSAQNWVFTRLSALIALILLGFLTYSGFRPNSEISSFYMGCTLAIGYGLPLIALCLHGMTVAWAVAANDVLENQIRNAQSSQDRFSLSVGGHELITDLSKKCIPQALSLLTTDPDAKILRLGKKDKNSFIQVSGRRKSGFSVEYQEGESNHFQRAHCRLTKETTVELLVLYSDNNAEWKDLADWEVIEGQLAFGLEPKKIKIIARG